MTRPSGRPSRHRIEAVSAVVLLHLAALLLVVWERSMPRASQAPDLQYISFWPQIPAEPENVVKEVTLKPSVNGPVRRFPVQTPATVPVGELPHVSENVDTSISVPNATVDWKSAAAEAAASIARREAQQKLFSAAPPAQRKPCKPRVFDENTKNLMDERLPDPRDPDLVGADPTANCIVVGGYPKCVQKILVSPHRRGFSADLENDKAAGKARRSSVPSPEFCE